MKTTGEKIREGRANLGITQTELAEKIGSECWVLIDEVDAEGAIGRTPGDAPEIDGVIYLNGETALKPGALVRVVIEHADEYDLWGTRV